MVQAPLMELGGFLGSEGVDKVRGKLAVGGQARGS